MRPSHSLRHSDYRRLNIRSANNVQPVLAHPSSLSCRLLNEHCPSVRVKGGQQASRSVVHIPNPFGLEITMPHHLLTSSWQKERCPLQALVHPPGKAYGRQTLFQCLCARRGASIVLSCGQRTSFLLPGGNAPRRGYGTCQVRAISISAVRKSMRDK